MRKEGENKKRLVNFNHFLLFSLVYQSDFSNIFIVIDNYPFIYLLPESIEKKNKRENILYHLLLS